MNRLERIIKGFNAYDDLVKQLITRLPQAEAVATEQRVNAIRNDVSLLIGELKRHGCPKEK